MVKVNILDILNGKWEDGTRPKDLYNLYISKEPMQYIGFILVGLEGDKRKVQSGCAELASLLSEDIPELLYPHIDFFIQNLAAKAPVLRWEAVCTLGNLAKVDEKEKIRNSVETIIEFLNDKSIVLQGHSVSALVKIVSKFPDLAPKILENLLGSADMFPGNRIGFIVEAMAAFVGFEELVPKARDFDEFHIVSEISSVSKKARKVLNLFEKGA